MPRNISHHKDIFSAEIDLGISSHRPQSIQHLADLTKFSRKEIQTIYRGFKQDSPNGLVSAEQFKEIYSQFFARGDSTHYANLVFNTFDRDSNGQLTFDEFVQALSIVSRGSLEEKLTWVFKLYDVDGDGLLTRPDLEKLISSVYALLGKHVDPPVSQKELQEHVDDILTKIDERRSGCVTLRDFVRVCCKDENICNSLELLSRCSHPGMHVSTV